MRLSLHIRLLNTEPKDLRRTRLVKTIHVGVINIQRPYKIGDVMQ